MKGGSLVLILTGLIFFSGCQAASLAVRPPLGEEGPVSVYLEKFPPNAEGLAFTIGEISALRSDGTESPLTATLRDVKAEDMKRQRRVASGAVRPGSYRGLALRIERASRKTETGETAFPAPADPLQVDLPFQIGAGKALLISLTLGFREQAGEGGGFSPAFTAVIPARPLSGLAGYAANYGEDTVTVFDKKAAKAVGLIAVGRGPKGIALDPRAGRAYVAASEDDSVEVIDIPTGTVITRLRLDTGDRPREPALTPDGRMVMTANAGSNTVSIIAALPFLELAKIKVGDAPTSVLIDGTGKRAYAFNTSSDTISVINVQSRAVAATVATERGPLRGQFDSRGERLYVIHEGSPYLTVIDPASLTVQNKVFVGMGMNAVKVDRATDYLYIGKRQAGVEVFDPFSLLPIDVVPTPGGTASLTIDGEENNLYVLIPEKRELSVVNLVSKRPVAAIDVGEDPSWASVVGER